MRLAVIAALAGALRAAEAQLPTPVPSNPFCAYTKERNTVAVTLVCVEGVIDALPTALFGTPAGVCPDYTPGACNDAGFAAYARAACIGQQNCTLDSQGDPCGGVVKSIAVTAHCSAGPGGYQLVSAAPSPTCALNGQPCPPPTWTPTWNLTESTVIQPSSPGYFMPTHHWGLISLDWSVAEDVWFPGHLNTSNTTCEATSVTNCRMLKAAGLATRCFIYHMELALQWLETQRAIMYQPQYANYFLQYTDGASHKNGTIYNEPRGEGDQYFWDFTQPGVAQYFIDSVLLSLSDPAVDGTFTDDVEGVPEEHGEVQKNINLTNDQLAALQFSTQLASSGLISTLAAAGKYNWQAFGAEDGSGGAPTKSSCATWMRTMCAPAAQGAPMLMSMDASPANKNQTVAAFFITRPPYAYIGWGWESGDEKWDDIFLLQGGTPTGLCAEGPAGVFTRPWTNGVASLDCNTWTAALPFPSL